MKIVQQSLTLLTLQERPIGIWLLSGLTAGLGLLIFISSNPPLDWFGFFCIICANVMMFGSPVKTCRFEKHRNRVILQQKGWLGTQVSSCSINKITKIHVESLNLVGISFYRLSLNLLSGERFYLTPVPSTDIQLLKNLAGSIQQFLRIH